MFAICNRLYRDVFNFRSKFGLPIRTKPTFPEPEVCDFRGEFAKEEAQELADAIAERDMAKTADALVDIIYVAKDTALEFGLDLDSHWDLVHRKNMEKERLPGVLKIQKPKGWTPPDHRPILDATAANEPGPGQASWGSVDIELARRIVEFMNDLLLQDREAISTLVKSRAICTNEFLPNHPTVQVRAYAEGEPKSVALVGLLNGLVGAYSDGWGAVGYKTFGDDPNGLVQEFFFRLPTGTAAIA